jgi:glycosyltransferase involved in cell wall biosynthesis
MLVFFARNRRRAFPDRHSVVDVDGIFFNPWGGSQCRPSNVMAPRLKLALVTRRYPPLIGGAERVLSYLAVALSAEGADVTVLTAQAPGPKHIPKGLKSFPGYQELPAIEHLRNGLKVQRLPTSTVRWWGTWLYMNHLRHWFHENPVDLAYVSMLKHDAYVVISAGEKAGFPVILRPEGAGATGDVAWQSWGNFGRRIGYRCRQATAFVAVSEEIERELQSAWTTGTMRASLLDHLARRTPHQLRVAKIPNGVPMPAEAWSCRLGWSASPRAVFVGRLAPEKGLDTLLNAWPLVRDEFSYASLIIVGDGPERSALEGQAREHGLSLGPGEAVHFAGSAAVGADLIRQGDLFVLPSREEGMSIALLEAMALGIPVVASSIPGNCRLVSDGEHGRLTPADDSNQLAQVIIGQWKDFDNAMRMGQAARRRIEADFSIEAVARKHLELFQQILGCKA